MRLRDEMVSLGIRLVRCVLFWHVRRSTVCDFVEDYEKCKDSSLSEVSRSCMISF
jgi:hypothetical protein